jgi:hypothetical protein
MILLAANASPTFSVQAIEESWCYSLFLMERCKVSFQFDA